jgi:FixJ family two-component response regulator
MSQFGSWQVQRSGRLAVSKKQPHAVCKQHWLRLNLSVVTAGLARRPWVGPRFSTMALSLNSLYRSPCFNWTTRTLQSRQGASKYDRRSVDPLSCDGRRLSVMLAETTLYSGVVQAEHRPMVRHSSQTHESPMTEAMVYVVDDDPSIREMLASLLRSVGLRVGLFGSASELLQSKLPDVPSCLVLDVRLPGLGGLDLQAELAGANIRTPIIFLTGYADIPMTVRAMKGGAVDFLTKPFRDQELLDAVSKALERDQKRHQYDKSVSDLRTRFGSLTAREQQVMTLATAGLMNKQTAGEMGLSEFTVKIHRGNVMKKMGARSLADLVKMAQKLGLGTAEQ